MPLEFMAIMNSHETFDIFVMLAEGYPTLSHLVLAR